MSVFFIISSLKTAEVSNLTRHPLVADMQQKLRDGSNYTDTGGVLLTYTGNLDSVVTDALLILAERSVLTTGGTRKQARRIGNVLIEALQNVIRHGWIDSEGENQLFLTLELTPVGYQIHTGNLVDFEMAAELRERIAQVNGMSHEELRKAYVETLCQGELSLRGGAGLGLISMAKKAEGTLNYQFDEQGNKLFLFTLGVLVKN